MYGIKWSPDGLLYTDYVINILVRGQPSAVAIKIFSKPSHKLEHHKTGFCQVDCIFYHENKVINMELHSWLGIWHQTYQIWFDDFCQKCKLRAIINSQENFNHESHRRKVQSRLQYKRDLKRWHLQYTLTLQYPDLFSLEFKRAFWNQIFKTN